MSLYAIHKETGQLIPSYKLESDLTWINKQKDEWLLPDSEISNLIEARKNGFNLACSFIKSFTRTEDNVPVQCHFRRLDDRVITISESGESEEHLLAKEKIYYKILNNELSFNIGGKNYLGSNLPKFNLFIEGGIGGKRADVLLIFEKEDIILGKGIVIEVQLSRQTLERTNERSFDRAIQGYSICWLFDNEFNSSGLINTSLNIKPFREVLSELEEIKNNEFLNRIAFISESIDKKIKEIKIKEESANCIINQFEKIISEKFLEVKNNYNIEIKNYTSNLKDKIKEEIHSDLNLFEKNINIKANKNVVDAEQKISEQNKIIEEKYKKAIDNMLLLINEKINRSGDDLIKKGQIFLENKLKNNLNWIEPFIKDNIQSILKEENIKLELDSIIKKIYFEEIKNNANDKFENNLQHHLAWRTDNFDKMMHNRIDMFFEPYKKIMKEKLDLINKEGDKNGEISKS